jgi:hypothetical protein
MSAQQMGLFDPTLTPAPKPPRIVRRLRVLITVKAAPNPSVAYGETVCVAGVSVDLDDPSWIRLYPINFRELGDAARFKKYDIVEVDAVPASNDARSESWRPAMSTLSVMASLPPWTRRRPYLDPYIEDSMCRLNTAAYSPEARSLAAVRVADVSDFVITPHPGWTPDEQKKIESYVSQLELFGSSDRTALEAPRFRGAFHWRCGETACNGHKQGLLDWEFVALQRRLAGTSDAEAREKLRERFLYGICGPGKDLAFYLGNQAKRHHVFSVLGAYYPPTSRSR